MANSKTGKNGSRASQRMAKEGRAKKPKPKNKSGRKPTTRALTVDDFDASLTHHVGGNNVDPVEGREVRLPYVIRGMRQNQSIREIAFQCECHPSTIAVDKKWVLEEAWLLRQDMMGLWLEEQLQQYENILSKLTQELEAPLLVKVIRGKEAVWEPRLDKNGDQILVVNHQALDKILLIMDKVNALKGLTQANIIIPIIPGDNATVNVGQDAAAARELLDVLKSRKVGNGKTPLVS